MSAQADTVHHVDWMRECKGTLFEHLVAGPAQAVKVVKPNILTAYPRPDLPVLNPDYWTLRPPVGGWAPYVPDPIFLWVMLLEICLFFHFHLYTFDRLTVVPHGVQLISFFRDVLVRAGISHTVPDWDGFLMKMSAAMQNLLLAHSLDVLPLNLATFQLILAHMYDLRYHLAASMLDTFAVVNTRRKVPTSVLFTGRPLPMRFGVFGPTRVEVAWFHGGLLIDHVLKCRQYVVLLVCGACIWRLLSY